MFKSMRIFISFWLLAAILSATPMLVLGQADSSALQSVSEAESMASSDDKVKKSNAADTQQYVNMLGAGNKIKLVVFGEDDLSGEFEIDSTGSISLPLMGSISAAGLEPRDLEKIIMEKLSNGYLVNPRVSIEVLNYKPIFILGEVNKPGSYPYVSGLTVINAVALGGGYTFRARTSSVDVIREKDGKKIEFEGKDNTLIFPGDTVKVDERLF